MEQIKTFMNRVDALSIRERGMILAGIMVIMFTVWDSFFIQPQTVQEKRLLADLQLKRAEQSVLNLKFQNLLRQQQGDPDAANREKLTQLKSQLEQIESEVKQSTAHLVSPRDMAMILQTILKKSGGLQLTEIKGLGVSPLLAPSTQDAAASSKKGLQEAPETGAETEVVIAPNEPANDGLDNAYKHGLQIKLEGDYMATLQYMQALEELQWKFFWDKLEYEVLEYPRARIVITLYTLSLEKDWIGV